MRVCKVCAYPYCDECDTDLYSCKECLAAVERLWNPPDPSPEQKTRETRNKDTRTDTRNYSTRCQARKCGTRNDGTRNCDTRNYDTRNYDSDDSTKSKDDGSSTSDTDHDPESNPEQTARETRNRPTGTDTRTTGTRTRDTRNDGTRNYNDNDNTRSETNGNSTDDTDDTGSTGTHDKNNEDQTTARQEKTRNSQIVHQSTNVHQNVNHNENLNKTKKRKSSDTKTESQKNVQKKFVNLLSHKKVNLDEYKSRGGEGDTTHNTDEGTYSPQNRVATAATNQGGSSRQVADPAQVEGSEEVPNNKHRMEHKAVRRMVRSEGGGRHLPGSSEQSSGRHSIQEGNSNGDGAGGGSSKQVQGDEQGEEVAAEATARHKSDGTYGAADGGEPDTERGAEEDDRGSSDPPGSTIRHDSRRQETRGGGIRKVVGTRKHCMGKRSGVDEDKSQADEQSRSSGTGSSHRAPDTRGISVHRVGIRMGGCDEGTETGFRQGDHSRLQQADDKKGTTGKPRHPDRVPEDKALEGGAGDICGDQGRGEEGRTEGSVGLPRLHRRDSRECNKQGETMGKRLLCGEEEESGGSGGSGHDRGGPEQSDRSEPSTPDLPGKSSSDRAISRKVNHRQMGDRRAGSRMRLRSPDEEDVPPLDGTCNARTFHEGASTPREQTVDVRSMQGEPEEEARAHSPASAGHGYTTDVHHRVHSAGSAQHGARSDGKAGGEVHAAGVRRLTWLEALRREYGEPTAQPCLRKRPKHTTMGKTEIHSDLTTPRGSSQTGYVVDHTNFKKRKTNPCDCDQCQGPAAAGDGASAADNGDAAPTGAAPARGRKRTPPTGGARERKPARKAACGGPNTRARKKQRRAAEDARTYVVGPEWTCTVGVPPWPVGAPPPCGGSAPGLGGQGGTSENAPGGLSNKRGDG